MKQTKKLSRQQVFSKVVRHLLRQGVQSLDSYGNSCVYRAPDGLTCAAGCLILDKYYSAELEGVAVCGNRSSHEVQNALMKSGVHISAMDLVNDLQHLHDHSPPGQWRRELTRLAKTEGLKFPAIAGAVLAAVLTFAAPEAKAQDGIPEPNRSSLFEINVCYSDANDSPVCESTKFPELIRDFGRVSYIGASPIDAARILSRIPNYALARYHHWVLGFDVLPRAQRQYADCVGRVRGYQTILGIYPRIDDPESPRLQMINAIREYLVPMDALQRDDGNLSKPPRLEDALRHVIAALASINERVYFTGLCEGEASALEAEIGQLLQEGEAAKAELVKLKKKKRR